jgi:hypothetical protein
MSLAHLSIQRVTGNRWPHVPSNEQRVQAFRAFQPVQLANAPLTEQLRAIEAAKYAAQAVPGNDYDNQLRDGFALKYGSNE